MMNQSINNKEILPKSFHSGTMEPQRVLYYFEEISKIPRGSGNIDAISNYLADFGRSHGLTTIQDDLKNVILIKEATPGYKNEEPIIIQGHMDMVTVHVPEKEIDMEKEGLTLMVAGDDLYADGTSLGGDDGIFVAMALAVLEDDTLPHPRLEIVITVNEETGMDGARGIDLSMLKGHRLINLDSEEEGVFTAGCAGGGRLTAKIPIKMQDAIPLVAEAGSAKSTMQTYRLIIGGLQGGHSGEEINKERCNSNILAGRLLRTLCREFPDLGLVSINGGEADNAIARETALVVTLPSTESHSLPNLVSSIEAEWKSEYASKDAGIFIRCQDVSKTCSPTPAYCAAEAARFIQAVPDGVTAMSLDVPGLVETSSNLGILTFKDGMLSATFLIRSSINSAKYDLMDRFRSIVEYSGGTYTIYAEYPGWEFRVNSPLREKMVYVYQDLFHHDPIVNAIHAGLECGMLSSKIPGMDAVSIGPTMKDIHTPRERLSISSTARVYDFLRTLLTTKD